MSKSEMSAYAHELADVLTEGEHTLGPTDSDLCARALRLLAAVLGATDVSSIDHEAA